MTHDPATAFTTRRGRVASFDDHVGAGTIAEGARTWSFHCTSIADGSRTIEAGSDVDFDVRPGPVGLEAFRLRPAR